MGYAIFPDGPAGEAAEAAYRELQRAKEKFPDSFKNGHEAYGVLMEEIDEWWDEIKADNYEAAAKEAVQVAAMALRIVAELTPKKPKKEVSHG